MTPGRRCTVCDHPEKDAINKALIAGQASIRAIAGQYSVSRQSLARHKKRHLSATLAKSQEAHEVARADDLLAQVRQLEAKALRILVKAEKAGQLLTALRGIGEARRTLELRAKLMVEIRRQGQEDAIQHEKESYEPIRIREVVLIAGDRKQWVDSLEWYAFRQWRRKQGFPALTGVYADQGGPEPEGGNGHGHGKDTGRGRQAAGDEPWNECLSQKQEPGEPIDWL